MIVTLAFAWYKLGGRIVVRNGKLIQYIPLREHELVASVTHLQLTDFLHSEQWFISCRSTHSLA